MSRELKTATEPVKEAVYELESSNPSHLAKIEEHIDKAIEYIVTLPDDDISYLFTSVKIEIARQTARYTSFSKLIAGYYSTVVSYDKALSELISGELDQSYYNPNIEELKEFIANYTGGELAASLLKLQELGLSPQDITDLMQVESFMDTIKDLSGKAREDFLKDIIASKEIPENSLLKKLAKSFLDETLGSDELDRALKLLESGKDTYIKDVIKNFCYPDKAIKDEALIAMVAGLTEAQKRYDRMTLQLAERNKTAEKFFRRYNNAAKDLRDKQADVDTLKDSMDSASRKNALGNFIVGGAITVITLAKEGYDAFNNGLRGEDIAQKMFSKAVGLATVSAVEWLAKISASTIVGKFVASEMISAATGSAIVGGIVTVSVVLAAVGYEIFLRPKVEAWWNRKVDEREQAEWEMSGCNSLLSNKTISLLDLQKVKSLSHLY